MDKYSENKISIKINGEEHNFLDNTNQSNVAIKDSMNEIAATNEISDNEEFNWVLPSDEMPPNEAAQKYSSSTSTMQHLKENKKIKKQKKGSIQNSLSFPNKSIFLSILLAVIIGLGFGAFILKVIATEKAAQVQTPQSQVIESDAKKNGNDKQQNVAKALSFQFTPMNAYVVQAGVFTSTVEKALNSMEAKQVSDLNIPLTIIDNEKLFLFIGIGINQDDVKALGSIYKENGINTYSKMYELKAKTIQVKNQEATKHIELTRNMFEQLLGITTNELIGKKTTNKLLNELETNYKKINFSILASENQLNGFSNDVNQAYQAFVTYHKSKDKQQLYQAQQALLDALAKYESI